MHQKRHGNQQEACCWKGDVIMADAEAMHQKRHGKQQQSNDVGSLQIMTDLLMQLKDPVMAGRPADQIQLATGRNMQIR